MHSVTPVFGHMLVTEGNGVIATPTVDGGATSMEDVMRAIDALRQEVLSLKQDVAHVRDQVEAVNANTNDNLLDSARERTLVAKHEDAVSMCLSGGCESGLSPPSNDDQGKTDERTSKGLSESEVLETVARVDRLFKPPRSRDSLNTRLIQISCYHSKDNSSLPNGFHQKLNKKGFKFGDAVMDHAWRKCYMIGHTGCRCTVVYEPIHRTFHELCVATLQNADMTLVGNVLEKSPKK